MTGPARFVQDRVRIWQVLAGLIVGFGVAACLGLWTEIALYSGWFVLFVVALLFRGRLQSGPAAVPGNLSRLLVFVLGSILGFVVIASFGWKWRMLPPAYHDEYSYLLQAEQFACGMLSGEEITPLLESPHFEQMHVLKIHGKVASRYFPGTGTWYSVFVLLGCPYLGGWILHSLTCGLMAYCASRWSVASGVAVGVLMAFSPAMVVFNSTLLSPGPAMFGLAIGWWGFQEGMTGSRWGKSFLGGIGIGFAFLSRPLTAAAVSLPWAIEAISCGWSGKSRLVVATLIAGFLPAPVLLAIHNYSITGNAFVTPYGLWTSTHSPSHVYGFYNQTRGKEARNAETIVAYDDWARELTPREAAWISLGRWQTAIQWFGGCIPVVVLAAIGALGVRRLGNAVLFPILSVLMLTLAHFPFAFEGVFGFSYIVESTPFVLFAAGLGFGRVYGVFRGLCRFVWAGLLGLSVVVSAGITLPQAFSSTSELIYPRIAMSERIGFEGELAHEGPILILYAMDRNANLHSTYVYHRLPCLNDTGQHPVFRAWKLAEAETYMDRFAPDVAVYECRLSEEGRPEYRLLRTRLGRPGHAGVD